MAGDFRHAKMARTHAHANMRSQIWLLRENGTNVNGESINEPGIPLKAYIERHDKTIYTADQTQVVSSMTIFVEGTVEIGSTDTILLEDGTKPSVIRVRPGPSDDLRIYTEISCA